MFRIHAVIACGFVLAGGAAAQTATIGPVPSHHEEQVVTDFKTRVNQYLDLRKKVAGSPQPTSSPDKLVQTQRELAKKIGAARAGAKQGDIFAPPIATYFRKQIESTLSGHAGQKVRTSLKHSEPVHGLAVAVNTPYPQNVPRQSTPPTLLANLPPLPKDLEYRIVNDDLVLIDSATSLVVDYIPHAIPAAP